MTYSRISWLQYYEYDDDDDDDYNIMYHAVSNKLSTIPWVTREFMQNKFIFIETHSGV